jgi:broad specificity phosphatase PhoE
MLEASIGDSIVVGGRVAEIHEGSHVARLIFVRHGQSVANAERRFTLGGHEPLSRQGRAEALTTARLLLERFDPVALYSSPFVRALETARLIGVLLGLEPIVVDALREQDFGDLRGRPYDAAESEFGSRGGDLWRFRPPGGETLCEVAERAGPALDLLALRHLGEEVVVVSHGGVMAALRAWARQDRGFAEPPVLTANAAGYILERRRRRYAGPFSLETREAE